MTSYNFFVYITTNPHKTVLYTGRSNDMRARITEHYLNRGYSDTFAGKYHCYNLLYFEDFKYIEDAILREKEIKGWKRDKKIALIKSINPNLEFLNSQIMEWPPRNPKRRTDLYKD